MAEQRPYRLFSGVAYPNLIKGDNPTRQVQATDLNDRHQVYHDPAIKLSEADIERLGSLVGKPICFEHDSDIEVGEITRAWYDNTQKLRINARIWMDTKCGQLAWDRLQQGKLAQLSVGYRSATQTNNWGIATVTHKLFDEVSLVQRGFFPGAEVTVSATNAGTYKSSSPTQVISFTIDTMASEQPETTPTEPQQQQQQSESAQQQQQPPVERKEPHDTSRELLREMDATQKEVERLKSLLAAKEKKTPQQLQDEEDLAELRRERAERQKRFQEEGVKRMEAMLAAQEELIGERLPEGYKSGLELVFASEKMQEPATVLTKLTEKAMSETKRADELQQRFSDLEVRLKAMEDNNTRAVKQVQASHRQIMGVNDIMSASPKEKEEASDVSVQASGNRQPTTMADAFAGVYELPRAHPTEQQLLEREGIRVPMHAPAGGPIAVNASGGASTAVTMQTLPAHRNVKHTPNSLARRFKETCAPWTWAMHQDTSRYASGTKLHMASLGALDRREATDQELGLNRDPTKTLPGY